MNSGGFDSITIANNIKELFPKAKVLIVIREQNSMIKSGYYQYLAGRGTLSLKNYLKPKKDWKLPHFTPEHFNYLNLIKYYHQLYNKKDILVLPFEMFRDEKNNFIDLVNDFLGTKIKLNKLSEKTHHNKARNRLVRYHLRFLNIFTIKNSFTGFSPLFITGAHHIIDSLLNIIGYLIPNYFEKALSRNHQKIIQEFTLGRYDKSNNELSELIGIDLKKYGY